MPRKPANKLNENEEVSKKKATGSVAKRATKKSATDSATTVKSTKTKATKSTAVKTAKITASKDTAVKTAKTTAKKESSTKEATGSKETKRTSKSTEKTAKAAAKKTTSTATKSATKKATSTASKKSAEKTTKATSKKSTNTASKKTTAKKATTTKAKRATRTKKATLADINPDEITSSTNLTEKIEILEYYDLPYRYNQTVVKVLAQTPTTLFIYWDISDKDRENFVKQYGTDFFNNTKPVLIIHNKTMNYSFEIEIDDFANSWYLHVNDSNCEYYVELGRRPKYNNSEPQINIPNNYLYVSSSNEIDSPNDHVLFDKALKTVYFKDVKTNIVTEKDITSISFLRNMGRIYNLYDLYSDFTKNAWINHWQLDLKNPSSSSSTFK